MDSVLLQETDSAYIGRLAHTFTVDSHGHMYIADRASDRLFRFLLDGQLDTLIGRHGAGPGEFNQLLGVTIPMDTILAVALVGGTFVVLDLRTGKELNRTRTTARFNSWARAGSKLALGLLNSGSEGSVVVAPIDSLVSGKSDLAPSMFPTPEVYHRYNQLLALAFVAVGIWNDTVVAGFGATNLLVRQSLQQGDVDSFRIPVRLRRGAPAREVPKYSDPHISTDAAVSGVSLLLGVWRLQSGGLLLWYQDPTVRDTSNPRAQIFGRAYISVLTPALDRACVDGEVLVPGTGLPRLAFASDTLYSIDQLLDQPGQSPDSVRTVIRRYVADPSECDWFPTRD